MARKFITGVHDMRKLVFLAVSALIFPVFAGNVYYAA